MKVSVIVPTYNGMQHIRETLDSVLRQTAANLEVIVIDDGSTDGSGEYVSVNFPSIQVHVQENKGIAGARNTGLSLATGDLIAFLDHDDVWHPDKIRAQVKLMAEMPDVGVCFGAFENWFGEDADKHLAHDIDTDRIVPELSGKIYHALIQTNHMLLGTALFRKSVIEEVGLFDVKLPPADDWDYAVRCSQVTDFAMLESVVTLYRIHATMTSKRAGPKDHETDFRMGLRERYGLQSADGRAMSPRAFRASNYRSSLSHAHTNLKAGNYDVAARSLRRAIQFSPLSMEPYFWMLVVAANVLGIARPSPS